MGIAGQLFYRALPPDPDELCLPMIQIANLIIIGRPADKICEKTDDVVMVEFGFCVQPEGPGIVIVLQNREPGNGLQVYSRQ